MPAPRPFQAAAAAASALNGVGRIGTCPPRAAEVAISICADLSESLFGGVILSSFRMSSMSTIELSSSSGFESDSISESPDAGLCGVRRSFLAVVELLVVLPLSRCRCAGEKPLLCDRFVGVLLMMVAEECGDFKLIGEVRTDGIADGGSALILGRVSASSESTLKLIKRLDFCCGRSWCGTVGLVITVLTAGVIVIPDVFIMNFFGF